MTKNHFYLPITEVYNTHTDPRWFTLPLYLILYTGLCAATLWLLFKQKGVLLLTAIGYGLLILLAGLLLLVSKLGVSAAVSYTIAQQLKELMLSPFLCLLLIALYYAAKKYHIA